MSAGLTDAEHAVIDEFGDAYRSLLNLPTCHPEDATEARTHIHALQNIVMARAAVRADPGQFTHEEGFK